MSKRSVIAPVAITIAALGLGFTAGQVAPQVVQLPGKVAGDRPDFSQLEGTYTLLKNKYDGDIDTKKVLDGARAGIMASSGDPYTVFLDEKATKELEDQLSGTLSGIGAEIGIKNERLTVISPIPGTPAEKAGLRPGDKIGLINGEDTGPLTVDQAVGKIRGQEGTKVKLTIVRGNGQPQEIEITRAVINVPSVTWEMKAGQVAYIKVSSFGNDTNAKVQQAASELKSQGARKVILDVRNDPGGYLAGAVAVTSQFLPEDKLVVDERAGGKTREKLTTTGGGQLVGLPMVVLMNGGSASASEIVAGALRDNGAATLIGEKTFGKGSVQEITKLRSGGELKITVARWYTPSGKNIDKAGLEPDIKVELTNDDFNAGRDPQLERALAELANK